MSNQPVSIQCFNEDQIGLALNFRRSNDRFKHEICIVQGDKQIVLLTSIESDPNESWPVSPPMQQISKETISGQSVVLGLGMAGKCHWSGSFLLKADPTPDLICELACLAKQPRGPISSIYALSPEWTLVEGSKTGQEWKFFGDSQLENGTVLLSTAECSQNPSRINIRDSTVLIQPLSDSSPSTSAIQWNYRLILSRQ